MKKGIARKMRKEANARKIQNDYNKELEWICENSALFPLLLLLLVLARSLTLTTIGLLIVHTIPNGIPLSKSKEGLEIEILLDRRFELPRFLRLHHERHLYTGTEVGLGIAHQYRPRDQFLNWVRPYSLGESLEKIIRDDRTTQIRNMQIIQIYHSHT
jgi:hypothetical protein